MLKAIAVATIASVLVLTACEIPAPTDNTLVADAPEKAQADEPRIDVAQLIDADKARVAAILGEPTSCHMEGRGEACAYGPNATPGEAIDVFFVGNRAANLTLPNFSLPFEPASLRAYGIEAGEPSFTSPAVTRWNVTINSKPVEVDMFPDGRGGINYVYLMTRD